MLFNSYEFIFVFLPIVLIIFFIIGGQGRHRAAISFLVGASLFFYGWWNPAYLGLIVGSMLFNYAIGVNLASSFIKNETNRKLLLAFGLIGNLGAISYFKYFDFFIENINVLFSLSITEKNIILPLAISFFTFQQIAYLVDAYKGITREYSFLHYCLFVLFFPQLIAGPIVHHKEMLPQFMRDSLYKFNAKHFSIGVTIFSIGLFKKIVIADGIAVYATPVFAAADSGVALTFIEAWSGLLAYSFQLYFDFSGYSDMAIGLARMFGVRLPLNFNSPYKATNIIDFWRRWHITLSRFLRDYLYIMLLGGNRNGSGRRYINLLLTMLLGGLWHGAGWGFALWGLLHGAYLTFNHIWRKTLPTTLLQNSIYIATSWALTFFAVVIAWVPFRAETFPGAMSMWSSMFGINGIGLPGRLRDTILGNDSIAMYLGINFDGATASISYSIIDAIVMICMCAFIAFLLPNTQQIMRSYRPAFKTYGEELTPVFFSWVKWRPNTVNAFVVAIIMYVTYIYSNRISEFLYFQF